MARKRIKAEDKPNFGIFNDRLRYRFTYKRKRYAVYGKTEEECREKERKIIQKVDEGMYKPGKELTVSEYFERWITAKQDSVRETTIRTNRILFNAMAETQIDKAGQAFGDIKLSAVETDMLRRLQAALREDHTVTMNGESKVRKARTTRTTNDSLILLKSLFQSAINDRIISWNPAAGIKSLKRTEPAARDTTHRALTKAETISFLEAAKESAYYNLYVFLLHTGCRIGEAGALLPGDIDSKGVRISRTITRTEAGGYMIGSETKTAAGRRFVPVDQQAAQAVSRQKIINNAFDGALDLTKPVFRSPYGSLLKSSSVNENIAKLCKAAGIERFTVHAFRDTFATRCVESGMQPKVLQDILGHTDISMTMNLYAHSMDESKMDQLKVVNFG